MISTIVGEIKKKFYTCYICGLLLCRTRKTCTQMAATLGMCHDALYRALGQIGKDSSGLQEGLITAAKKLLNSKKKWWFVLDDSMLQKPHIKKLKQAIRDHCGATGRVEKGLVALFLAITDGEIAIPIAYEFWLSKKHTHPDKYAKKWEIGMKLLEKASSYFNCNNLLMDGAYANRYVFPILARLNFNFEARFRKNGTVLIDSKKYNIPVYLAQFFKGRRRYATTPAIWQGILLFFTAHKHTNKSGSEITTYTVSNENISASQHAKNYLLRWGIEVFFRTSKQSFGIHHCSSTKIELQTAHINACLVAYTVMQHRRKLRRLRSVEDAIHSFRSESSSYVINEFNVLERSFTATA